MLASAETLMQTEPTLADAPGISGGASCARKSSQLLWSSRLPPRPPVDVPCYLDDFFAGKADFNCDRVTDSQDFFDYLGAFFTPC
jgi:hypothetical protein